MSHTQVNVIRLTDKEIAAICEALAHAGQWELVRKILNQTNKGPRK